MIPELTPLLEAAGIDDPETQQEFEDMTGSFVAMMSVLLRINKGIAPNFLTFALDTPLGDDRYALTIQKVDGMTPCQRISQLEAEVAQLRSSVSGVVG